MFIGVFQVFGRKLINFPVPGYVDVIEFVMTVFAFISIAYTQRLGGHVRMEIIPQAVPGPWPLDRRVPGNADRSSESSQSLAWFAYGHFLRAWTIGDSTIDIEIPLWPSKLLIPIAFAVLLVRLFIQLLGFLRLSAHPEAEPVGIPLIETVDEQAQHEIETGLAGKMDEADPPGGLGTDSETRG